MLGLALGCGDDDAGADVGTMDAGAGDVGGFDAPQPDSGPGPDAGPEEDASVPACGTDCDPIEVGVNSDSVCAHAVG